MATVVLLCALVVLAGKRRRVVNEKTCVARGRHVHFSPRKTLVLRNGGGGDSSVTITPLNNNNNNKTIVGVSERTRVKELNCRRQLACIVRTIHPLRISYCVYLYYNIIVSTVWYGR